MPSRTETIPVDQDIYNEVMATVKKIKFTAMGLFTDEGITSAQLWALGILQSKGPMLMRMMSEAMDVTPANITGIVDRLEEKKLVLRKSGKKDRRATIIEITPEGKALYERLGKKEHDMIQKGMAQFTKDEKISLYRLLEKFQKGMTPSADRE